MASILGGYFVEIIFGLISFCLLIYYIWTIRYDYWKRLGVPYIPPTFPFGNMKDFFLSKSFIGTVYKDHYFKLEGHSLGGIISLRRPILLLRDPEIIKQILTKDFNYFTDRGIAFDEKLDPLNAHLFNLKGEVWRVLRHKLTPTFTSGKIKMMFTLMIACGKELQKSLRERAENEDVVGVKEYMARFGTDVIGNCAFGLDINSINDPDNEFRKISKTLFQITPIAAFRNVLNSIIPGLAIILKFKSTPKEREDFFFRIVRDTINYREKNNVKRNDFLELLIQIKNKGKPDDDATNVNEKDDFEYENHDKDLNSKGSNDIHMTNELMTAQCFLFFVAGYETSSSTLNFCLYELALNKDIQNKLQSEIDKILDKHNGEITYECLKEMTYMDRVVQETLRKYPPLGVILRECVKDYILKEENIEIKKGIRIQIPVYGLHYDPKYYPEPEKFDPDRFTESAKQSRPNYTFLPFGEGPRNCIGMRFGLLQVKTGLTVLLSKYKFDCAPNTDVPMKFSTTGLVATPENELKLRISMR